ncbi:hypothetical protein BH23GEM10_BH23GEM10_10000 [soil metagenome]
MRAVLRAVARAGTLATMLALAGGAAPLHAQSDGGMLSSEIAVSGSEALLQLEWPGGRTLEMVLRDGGIFIAGTRVGDAARGSVLDREWRELLSQAMETSAAEIPQLLADWSPSGSAGARMKSALDAALQSASGESIQIVAPATGTDSVDRLVDRISELEARLAEQRDRRVAVERPTRRSNPFRYITEGIAGIFSLLVTYVVLFSIGVAVIFFGGRRYIEGVADTARYATGRSLMVGVASAFLVVPAFVLGIIALVISIIGIPGLLVWGPGFPLAVVLSILLGYLGVAHAAGEALAERRFYVTDWFQRGNSYFFLLSGLGLLLALFLASYVVHMGGSWLQPIRGMLVFLGVVSTGVAVCIGFGAVLLSRGGTRPIRKSGMTSDSDLFGEGDTV